ncbi:MAG: hypothetical protein JSV44_08705, partial [Candidatus Zixiibacteriota bacterium]
MNGRSNRLFFTALFAILLSLIFGCTQPEDIMAPASTTDITLNPERLPSPPPGYAYALWIVDTDGEPIFIDIFDWDSELYLFRDTADTAGNRIDPIWTIDFDILQTDKDGNLIYDYLSMTVEELAAFDDTTKMGPVMLQTDIHDPAESPIRMAFPMDLWLGNGTFCVETPTDKESDSFEDGGIWFAIYIYDSILVNDTLDFRTSTLQFSDRELEIDTIAYWKCLAYDLEQNCIDSELVPEDQVTGPDDYDWVVTDTLNLEELANTLDTIGYANLDTTGVGYVYVGILDTLVDAFGQDSIVAMDTLAYEYITFDYVATPVNVGTETRVDTVRLEIEGVETTAVTVDVDPFQDITWFFSYQITTNVIFNDYFVPAFDDMPDLDGTGWHYKGWILSPYIDTIDYGKLTKPVWEQTAYNLFLNPVHGGMITTGSFRDFEGPDDGNPYSMTGTVPP